jgi:AcrR family transcriptional regulator
MGVKRPRRRSRGSLSRELIVEAGLALADEAGLEGLTMHALAARLDCGVMSLYGHVGDKDDLLEAIVHRGLADIRLPRPLPPDVAGILRAWGRALRDVLLLHPALPSIFLDRPIIGPGIIRGLELLLSRLEVAGLARGRGVHAVYAVLIYSVGSVAWEIPRVLAQPPTTYASAWRREVSAIPAADLPHLSSVLDEVVEVAGARQFEFGLDAMVSGLARV